MHALRRHRTRRLAAIARPLDRSGAFLLLATAGVVLAILFFVVAVTPAHAADTRTLNGDYAVDHASRLELGIPFGEIHMEGTDGSRVRVTVTGKCKSDHDCGKFLDDLRLESSNRGGTLKVKLEGTNLQETWNHDGDDSDDDDADDDRGNDRNHANRHRHHGDDHDSEIEIVVQVPRSLQVDLNMGAGTVDIEGLRRDLSIDLGAGEVTVKTMERHVGSVDVNMAIGETTIHQGGRTREYARVLGGPVHWREGKGDAGIEVNIGAGEVDVNLE